MPMDTKPFLNDRAMGLYANLWTTSNQLSK